MADQYTRENRIVLQVWADDGHNEFNGIAKRTLDAFARRGLVWYETNDYGRHTGGLTAKGRAVLAELDTESDVEGPRTMRRRHGAEVITDKLREALDRWPDSLDGADRDAIGRVIFALERIADPADSGREDER